MGKIDIKGSIAEAHSDGIKYVTAAFMAQEINLVDNKSSISAIQKGNMAYQSSQNAITKFGGTLSMDADNIRSINIEYKQYDEMIAQVISINQK